MRVWWSSALVGVAAGMLTAAPVASIPSSASPPATVLPSGGVIDASDASVQGAAMTPADGRLRGEDFAATVTGVAWPDQVVVGGKNQEPTLGHRFIAFNLTLAENVSAITPDGTDPAVTAAVRWDGVSHPLSLGELDNTMAQQSTGSDWPTASGQFFATVPNDTHVVDLVLSQGSFSQAFNLWSLRRIAPAPAVLYRDPMLPRVSTTAPGAQVALSDPADGFSDTDEVTLQSATLSYFGPPGTTSPTSFNQAILSVVLDSEYPDLNYGDPNWGHYLTANAPLPASLVSFTPTGASAVPATLSGSGATTGKGNDDDGFFDATYSFVVPATLTTGAVTVGPGSFTGTEYTGFTGGSPLTLNLAAFSLPMTFPAVPAAVVQKKPPWVGQPLPPTAAAASSSAASVPGGDPKPFPIWLAVVVLVALAAAVVLVQRQRRRRSTPTAAEAGAPVVTAPGVATQSAAPPADHALAPSDPPIATAAAVAAGAPPAPTLTMGELTARVLGPPDAVGWRQEPDRRIVTEIVCWMVFHHDHLHSADEVLVGVYPTEGTRREVNRETFFTYLSKVRQCVGPEHLPDATEAGGYGLLGVTSDWETFQGLSTQADLTDGPEAIELRTRALALVRGVPFQGVPKGHYGWAFEEQLHHQMTSAIVTCAIRLANDLFDLGRYMAVDEACRAGLRADRTDTYLLEIQARAADVRNEGLARPGRYRGDTDGAEETPGADDSPDGPDDLGSGT
jgi:hypothetical protein